MAEYQVEIDPSSHSARIVWITNDIDLRRLVKKELEQGKTWSDFTKEKSSIEHGHRLENYTWRMWYIKRRNYSLNRQHKDLDINAQKNTSWRKWAVQEKKKSFKPKFKIEELPTNQPLKIPVTFISKGEDKKEQESPQKEQKGNFLLSFSFLLPSSFFLLSFFFYFLFSFLFSLFSFLFSLFSFFFDKQNLLKKKKKHLSQRSYNL